MGRWHRRFSSRFSDLADLLRESAYVARREGAEAVDEGHIRAAREAYKRRHSLTEDRTHDLIAGRAAEMQTIAVLTGVAGADELAPFADVVFPDIGHIAGWLAE